MNNLIKDWLYNKARKIIIRRILKEDNILTPQYLSDRGWIKEDECYVESNVKVRDKIWISFEHYYYRVYHGEEKTFIALRSETEWFETYYLLLNPESWWELTDN